MTVKPRNPDKVRSFKDEVSIADKGQRKEKESGYEFSCRIFEDKVSKEGYDED